LFLFIYSSFLTYLTFFLPLSSFLQFPFFLISLRDYLPLSFLCHSSSNSVRLSSLSFHILGRLAYYSLVSAFRGPSRRSLSLVTKNFEWYFLVQHAENMALPVRYVRGVPKSFRTESITKNALTKRNTHWEATQRVMAAKLTRLTHKNSDATARSGREPYHLQFSLQEASPETFGRMKTVHENSRRCVGKRLWSVLRHTTRFSRDWWNPRKRRTVGLPA
jgi:hypothetical protein